MAPWHWGTLVALTALAATLRLHALAVPPLSLEEIQDVVAADRPLAQVPAAVARQTGATPLHALVLRGVMRRFGRNEAPLRSPAALAGTATVAVLFALGMALFPRPPLFACTLLAVSASHVAISREALAASLAGLLVSALLLLAWRVIRGHDPALWPLLALVGTASMYAHYGGLLTGVALGLTATAGWGAGAFTARAAATTLATMLASVALFAPWAGFDLQHGRGAAMFVPSVTFDTFELMARYFATGIRAAGVFAIALAAGFVAGIIRGLLQHRAATLFLVAVVSTAIGGTLLVTYHLPHPFHPHQIAFVLPLYLLLAGWGLEWPLQLVPPRWHSGCQLLVAAAFAFWGASILRAPVSPPPPNWEAVAKVVGNNAWADDTIVAPEVRDALIFYAPAISRQVLPELAAAYLRPALDTGVRTWVVAPSYLRLSALWPPIARWIESHNVVDLSTGDDPIILYGGKTSRAQLLREIAAFELPDAPLARGTWLRELVQLTGPVPLVGRLVDQLISSAEPLAGRNLETLRLVTALAEAGDRDRARALAKRIVAAEPDWVEAQQALAALPSAQ
jgi:hypothetical protein